MKIVPDDEAKRYFSIPAWLNKMVENNWLGDKTGKGFFKKIKGGGRRKRNSYSNLKTIEYKPRTKTKICNC